MVPSKCSAMSFKKLLARVQQLESEQKESECVRIPQSLARFAHQGILIARLNTHESRAMIVVSLQNVPIGLR